MSGRKDELPSEMLPGIGYVLLFFAALVVLGLLVRA